MPTAQSRSEEALLCEAEELLGAQQRYQDLMLVFRHKKTGRELLRVGGRWDRTKREYLEPDPEDLRGRVIFVNDNQVATVERFRDWLDGRLNGGPRQRLLITGGGRRGGKSFIITALTCAVCIAIPGALTWYVSPTLKRRDELERYTKRHTPQSWRTYSSRELTFNFANGSKIVNITGDDAEDLKRGEADLISYNEPQAMTEDVLTYGAPAIIDKGGLLLFAGNPARKRKGVWFTRLVRAIEEGKYTKGDFCRLSAKDNPDIDSLAQDDVSELMHLVNPEAARADDEGLFIEPGLFAYAEHFEEKRNTITAEAYADLESPVTAQIIRRAGGPSGFDNLNGIDFNGWPFNAGVALQAHGDPNDPTWYVDGYLLKEGDEDDFLTEAYPLWDQARTFWIGDASGGWQNAHHTQGRTSFDKFKARRWRIEPPQIKRSDRGDFPANPAVEDRVNLVNKLLDRGKLIIVIRDAQAVAEALTKCEVGPNGKPRGRWAHLCDALGYPLWWATPKAKPHNTPPSARSSTAVSVRPKGIRML